MAVRGALGLNVTESQLITLGAGKIYGVVVNSHTSGTMKVLDGVDNTAGAYATSTLTTSGIVYAKFPQSVLTSNATAPSNNATVTIGSIVYTYKTALSAGPTVAYEVLIGISAATALDNLKSAVNATTGAGTTYSTGTLIHPDVTATTNTDTTQLVVSKVIGTANNTKATTETDATLSWADTTLGGGTGTSVTGVATASSTFVIDGVSYYFTNQLSQNVTGATAVANEILWVTNDATALDNMKLAVNGTGVEGTDYSTGTNANESVIATTNGATTQIIQAKVFGSLGNSITTTETMTTTTWTGTTLAGGTDLAKTMLDTFSYATGSSNITFPEPITFSKGLYMVLGNTQNISVIFN